MRLFSSLSCTILFLTVAATAWAQDAHDAAPAAAGHDDAHGATGLPQLDISTFPSQIFWLLVMGLTLYVLMAKFALPKIEQIMHARNEFVRDNLHRAAELRHKAENVKMDYDRTLHQAENNAKDFLANTVKDLRDKHDATLQNALSAITSRTAEVEARLQREKDTVMQTLDHHAARLADEIMLNVFETKPASL